MNLIDRLPHKPPALLVETVIEIDKNRATCALTRSPDESLAPGGLLPAPMGLEAIAQAAAIWMCWNYDITDAKGMLVQCRNFEMKVRQLDCRKGLVACAKPVSTGSATGLYLFEGEIKTSDGEILAHGCFMIFSKGNG